MLQAPYDALICQVHPTERLKLALQRADLETPLPPLVTPLGKTVPMAAVVVPNGEYDDVPGFTQWLDIAQPSAPHPRYVLDGRPFMRWDRRTNSYRLTAENDFAFQCNRLILSQILADGQRRRFYSLGEVPLKTFSRWVTMALAQRFGLDLETQMRVAIICAYYYRTQLSEDRELDLERRRWEAVGIGRAIHVPATKVLELGEQLTALKTPDELAAAIALHGGSVRLEKIKFADLFALLSASWVGVNSRENVGVALEHVPTYIAMLYAALGERSYRKTVIATRAQTVARQTELQTFVYQVYNMVQTRLS